LIKTILAWWTAQIQSQIRLHIDSAAQNLIPRLAARLGFKTARLNSARLGSARGWWCGRWVPLCWRVCWLVDDVAADMACLLCMLTSHLHQADVIPGMPTVHADITIMSCWCHLYPGQSHGSGQLVFGSGQPIRAKKTRGTHGRVCARGRMPCRRVMESAAMSNVRFWRRFHQWLRLGLLYTVVWSKHNFDNFHFWAKSNTPLNHQLWYQFLGNYGTPCADRGCTDSCLEKGKHTDTIVYVVQQIAYIHGRESILFRDRERIQ